ncbi:hypothetical protein B0H14DRAFT_2633935 [Mycena olivaceomarginata]|nr:hypothetical protein B0H14DRAFT_2633935 [Mycena olivaceomarginata]
MIAVVRRLLIGPQTWSPSNLGVDVVPEVSRKITVHRTIAADFNSWSIKLLPSGRYFLWHNSNGLECWSVTANRLIWTDASANDWLEEYAADDTDANSLIVMICSLRRDANLLICEIVSVDVQTGTHNCVFKFVFVSRSGHFSHTVIRGPIAAVCVQHSRFMIIDWRAQSYVVLECQNLPLFCWRILRHSTLEDTDVGLRVSDVNVHESPVQEGEYRVWIYGTGALVSYRLSIPTNGEPRWHQRAGNPTSLTHQDKYWCCQASAPVVFKSSDATSPQPSLTHWFDLKTTKPEAQVLFIVHLHSIFQWLPGS